MVIAINTLFFKKENESDFLKKVFYPIIVSHPEHTFLLISHKDTFADECQNVINLDMGTPPIGTNRRSLWLYFKIKKILKKYKTDVLINNGEALLSFKEIPQIIFNPELKFLQNPSAAERKPGWFFKVFAKRYYQKSDSFIVVSDFEKKFLKKKFRINKQKIHVIQFGAEKNLIPIDIEEREICKEKYAKGFEYFLYAGSISTSKNLINLLKAFSAFKKRQKSSMQLILMGKEGALYNDFKKMIDLYKYKNDVHLMEGLSSVESDHIVSSAYAMIFPDQLDKSVNTLLTAIKYEVPSIVTKTGSLSDAGGNSVLHYESESISDLAGKMMLLFKDEKFRRNLVENSRSWVDKKNFQHGLEETWQIIQTAGNKNKNIDNGHLYVRNKILKDN